MDTAARTTQPEMKTQELFFSAAAKVEQEAYTKSEQIAQDTRFSDVHKATEHQRFITEALQWIDQHAKSTEENLNKTIARYEPLAAVQIAPSIDEAAALSYTKDVVLKQWETWAKSNHKAATISGVRDEFGNTNRPGIFLGVRYPQEMAKAWQDAINKGDKITARVYRDFAENFLRTAQGLEPDEPLIGALEFIPELQEKTLDMLRNDEQKQAAQKVRQARFELKELKRAVIGHRHRLENARLSDKGKVYQKTQRVIQF
jgi:hypothetical protein